MGTYPHQDFVYGIMTEEPSNELWDEAEEARFAVGYGGEGTSALIVGFKLDTFKVVEDGYLGGLWITKFNKEYFDKWYEEAKAKMTPDTVERLQDLVGVKDEPALWTISRMG